MTENLNLEQYLSKGIEALIKDAVKAALKNSKERDFLIKYAVSAGKAGKLRAGAEKRGEHIPPFLIASITGKCNLRCAGCYAQANVACSQAEMDVSEWRRIFTEAKELGIVMILLAGGEPFLRPEVIAEAAKQPEILFPIFTNGTILREQDYSLLDTYRNLVPILSIEGNEAVTDARRGSGVYSYLMDAMRKFISINILFGVSITVTKENMTQVMDEEFVDGLYQKGCKIVFYVEYVPVETETLALSDAERTIFENRLSKLREKEMIFISFPGDEKETGGCLAAGRGFFHITANGDAEPCPFSPYSDTNLRNTSLREALRSPLFTKLISGDILLKEHNGGCVLFEHKEAVKSLL